MAIILNDNLKINAGKPVDSKYLNLLNQPYGSVSDVNSTIPISERYVGLTVNINNVEYWYKLGVTDSDLLLKTVGGSGGSGENITKNISQTNHGFIVGDVIGYTSNGYVKAIADGTFNGETFGLVTSVENNDNFSVTFAGYVEISGVTLQTNTLYYLSDQNLGQLTVNEPIELGHISKPILYTTATNEGLVLNYRGIKLATGNTSGGGGSSSGLTQIVNIGNGEDIFKSIITTIDGETAQFRRIRGGIGTNVVTSGDSIIVNVTGSSNNIIGDARDVSGYTDGLFPFETTTPVGFAIDDINEFLASLAPSSPPSLRDHFVSGSFVDGNLSFGSTKNDIGYNNVSTNAGFSAIDINNVFSGNGDRMGITNSSITGILNFDVTDGEPNGIPYEDGAFSDANVGILQLELNGNVIDVLDLEFSTSNINSLYMSVTELKFGKFNNGSEFQANTYRLGDYALPTGEFVLGYNYLRIIHSGSTFNRKSNYVDWVFDPNTQDISITSPQIQDIDVTDIKYISGVKYNGSGSFDYAVTASNVYKNIYAIGDAIDFINKEKVGSLISIDITGNGIVNGTSKALPDLITDNTITNPESQDINILAYLQIEPSKVVIGNTDKGTISTEISIAHPFNNKSFSGGEATASGFLIYPTNQMINLKNEDFTGEKRRIEALDYKTISYNAIDLDGYEWDETENIVTSTSSRYNNAMLVINGELVYPNADYLTTNYGITNGDFSLMINGEPSNVNYNSASGIRNYYRLFQSSNTNSLSELFIEVTHTGGALDFLTNSSTSGMPVSSTDIKMELLIKRGSAGSFETHGWFNPFSIDGSSQEGITVIGSPSHDNGVTSVSCIFPPSVRIGNDDYVIMRLFFSSSYENRISNIKIKNL